ncbi:hypothetical protein HYT51_02085 [Candidatus Woesearchaeota archaeon]|nr:hypothetical protein [Candidatus Woesearchaeota archaeon]
MKKADVWISAVLYMALGIILLTLILAAGLPVIKKIKDKNTALQTKDLMFQLDKSIKAVYTQGPGSQRPITLEVRRGLLTIDQTTDTIIWTFETSVLLSEPTIPIQEGNLLILTEETGIEENYQTTFTLEYATILDISSSLADISGTNRLMITNTGSLSPALPVITITQL